MGLDGVIISWLFITIRWENKPTDDFLVNIVSSNKQSLVVVSNNVCCSN